MRKFPCRCSSASFRSPRTSRHATWRPRMLHSQRRLLATRGDETTPSRRQLARPGALRTVYSDSSSCRPSTAPFLLRRARRIGGCITKLPNGGVNACLCDDAAGWSSCAVRREFIPTAGRAYGPSSRRRAAADRAHPLRLLFVTRAAQERQPRRRISFSDSPRRGPRSHTLRNPRDHVLSQFYVNAYAMTGRRHSRGTSSSAGDALGAGARKTTSGRRLRLLDQPATPSRAAGGAAASR